MTLLSSIHQVLIGHVGEHSHPLHPGFVHFPLAFYSLAYTLDILSLSKQVIPRYLPFPGFIGAAWYLHAAGVITAVPAAITGIAEYFVIRKQSPARSWSILHGGLNVAITTISLFQLFSRSRNIYLAPTRFQVSLSAIGAILGMLSGYVGGLLVYKHAVSCQSSTFVKFRNSSMGHSIYLN
ncbi:hypothetical protein BKA69DRAFT_766500 [Paraphysoderma sedebokerense]|nr:hypothetical protein BKA69DRAFT_766500 [Paraphysoderma sedebokerense]